MKSPHVRSPASRPRRRQFGIEPLESRHLPSASLPGIGATQPADGAVLVQAPQSFTITFDRSVVDRVDATLADLFSISPDQVLPTIVAVDNDQDIEIDRIGADGTATPFLGGSSNSPVLGALNTTTAPDGTTQFQMVVSLPAGSPTIGPGTYQLDVLPLTFLAGAFGTVEPDSAWATAIDPIPVARFTVLGHTATLGGATDLGTAGPALQSVSGFIEPGDPQSAVELYRFTLPTGGRWQLNARIDTRSVDSALLSALTVFDAQGNVLSNTASASDPIDPSFSMGLEPGTYYIGVSGKGNLAGSTGGYDPVTGMPGTLGLDQPGGPFLLDLSAIPAPRPTRLIGFHLDDADPLQPSPTGLDVKFSGPVDVSSLASPDRQETALAVVDSRGRTWPITAVDYQASQDRLSFIFDEALPAGAYSLVDPSPGGLTDLSGEPVVGPARDPSGVLASWTVAASARPSDPKNLGVLWPGPANVTWNPDLSDSTALGVGQSSDYRFVVICPGVYQVQTLVNAGAVDLQIRDGKGATVFNAADLTQLNDSYVTLEPGVYHLRLSDDGSRPAEVEWDLGPKSLDYEKLLDNGVGQAPALGLTMVGPMADSPGSSPGTAGSGWATTTATPAQTTASTVAGMQSTGETSATGGSGVGSIGASPIPAALLVTLETGLAGLPAPGADNVSTIGPMSMGTTVVATDAGRGLPQGILSRTSSDSEPRVGEDEPIDGRVSIPPSPTEQMASARPAVVSDPADASARADESALVRADRVVRIAGWFADRIADTPAVADEIELPAAELGTTLVAMTASEGLAPPSETGVGPARAPGSGRELAQADVGAPFTLLVAAAMTYRLSQPMRKWWRRYDPSHAAWPRPFTFRRGPRPPTSLPNPFIHETA